MKELSVDFLSVIIKELKEAISVKKVEKGFSYDLKYKIKYKNGTKLLRIYDLKQKEQVFEQLKIMRTLHEMGVNCPKVYAFEEVNEHNLCYSITDWLDGEDGEEAIPKLDVQTQYEVGYDAGRELRLIHTLKTDQSTKSSEDHSKKSKQEFETCLKRFKQLNLNLPYEDEIIHYVYDHYDLLEHRPIVFTHGDFHANNIVVKDGKYAGVIDFERCKMDCPYHEFNKIELFSSVLSKEFSRGVIDGYFQNKIPDNFWLIRSFYMARNIIFHIVWATDQFPDEFNRALQSVKRILKEYENFTRTVPKWYVER
jgi:aminoglycoside phosphotransferase (APT) family kinase protein